MAVTARRGRAYLAGPMTGYPDYNYPAFAEAAKTLRMFGFDVVSPAELDGDDHEPGDWPWEEYLRRDLRHLLTCESIVLLDGWQESKGARVELEVAETLGMDVYRYTPGEMPPLEPLDETVPQAAQRLVYGDRQADYGHPYDDYSKVARIWSAIWGHKLTEDLTAHECALGMVGVKMSREANRPKRDNRIDMAGYAAVLDRIVDRMPDPEQEEAPQGGATVIPSGNAKVWDKRPTTEGAQGPRRAEAGAPDCRCANTES